MEKTATKQDLIKIGTDLFFLMASPKTEVSDMVLTILDFKEVELPADATVEEVYEIAKIGRARFYLSSELLTQEKTTSKETQPSSDIPPAQEFNPQLCQYLYWLDGMSYQPVISTPQSTEQPTYPDLSNSNLQYPYSLLWTNTEMQQQTSAINTELQQQTSAINTELQQQTSAINTELQQQTSAIYTELQQQTSAINTELQQTSAINTELQQQTSAINTELQQQTSAINTELQQQTSAIYTELQQQTSAINTELQQQTSAINTELQQQTSAINTELQQQTSAINTELQQQTSAIDTELQQQTSAINTELQYAIDTELQQQTSAIDTELQQQTSAIDSTELQQLSVHRVNIKDEMIGIFKDPSIMDQQVKFAYVNELGIDNLGVSRDIYIRLSGLSFYL